MGPCSGPELDGNAFKCGSKSISVLGVNSGEGLKTQKLLLDPIAKIHRFIQIYIYMYKEMESFISVYVE